MTYSAVIFDLDGTLIDSMPYYATSWQQAFRELHRIEIDLHSAYYHEGVHAHQFVRDVARQLLNREFAETVIEETYLRQRAIFQSLFEPRFFPGAAALVDLPRRFGLPVGLVSGSRRPEIVFKTGGTPDFLDRFSVIVSGEDTSRGKPHPEPFQLACDQLGCSPERVLVIENAPLGLQSAVAAGADCWVVKNNSPLGTEWAAEHGAAQVLEDLAELARSLESCLQS